MAKQHDDWLAKLGAAGQKLPTKETKVSVDHKTLAVRKFPDGLGLAGGYEHVLGETYVNLQCGPVPMLVSLRGKLSFEGEGKATGLQRDERTFEVGFGVGVNGTVAVGPGKHVEHFTVHAYAGATLGAKGTVRAIHTESQGWDVAPLKIVVYGKGSIGARIEGKLGDKHREVMVETKLDELELLVVEMASWKSGKFGSVTVKEGKDVERIRQFFRDPGQPLEEIGRWMAESETAKKIAAKTGEVIEGFHEATGIDAGQMLEDGVALALGEQTRAEREAMSEQQRKDEAALRADFEAETAKRRIRPGQALANMRTAAEWNKLQDALSSDVNAIVNGMQPARHWMAMLDKLDGIIHDRRVKQARDASIAKSVDARAALLQQVNAARFSAQKNSNWLSGRLPADRNHLAWKLFAKGDELKRRGDDARAIVEKTEGDACEAAAKNAKSLYQQAFLAFVGGQKALPAAAPAKQAETA